MKNHDIPSIFKESIKFHWNVSQTNATVLVKRSLLGDGYFQSYFCRDMLDRHISKRISFTLDKLSEILVIEKRNIVSSGLSLVFMLVPSTS